MIDAQLLRNNPEIVKNSLKARGMSESLVDDLLDAEAKRRTALTEFENLRANQKAHSKNVAKAKGDEKQQLLSAAKEMAAAVKAAEAQANAAQKTFDELMFAIPNVICDGVPSGGEDDYEVIKHVGTPRDFKAEGFTPLDHLELGESFNAIDTKRGAKVSGARFYFLTGWGARLELALLNLAMDLAIEKGMTPVLTPTLVKPEVMGGTGFLGAHAPEVYYLEQDDLYLTGTSEVALAGFHADEIIDLSDGPVRLAGWSTCYRREAGSYGKDTRGIIRVHQFNKIEMFVYCQVEDAVAEHDRLLAIEEEMLAKIELPYRVIDTAAGDLGSSAARKYDCEAWMPTQNCYRELTSTSNCTTFQARRLNTRERTEDGTRTVATLNGTLVTGRWLAALLENHQQSDGSVVIPKALQPYLGGLDILKAGS